MKVYHVGFKYSNSKTPILGIFVPVWDPSLLCAFGTRSQPAVMLHKNMRFLVGQYCVVSSGATCCPSTLEVLNYSQLS